MSTTPKKLRDGADEIKQNMWKLGPHAERFLDLRDIFLDAAEQLESAQAALAEKDKEIARLDTGWNEANIDKMDYAKQLRASDESTLKLIATIKYLSGIAARGTGRGQRDNETTEEFVLAYAQSLEEQLRASNKALVDLDKAWRYQIEKKNEALVAAEDKAKKLEQEIRNASNG